MKEKSRIMKQLFVLFFTVIVITCFGSFIVKAANSPPKYYKTGHEYKLQIYVDGSLNQTCTFEVEGKAATSNSRADFVGQQRNLTTSKTIGTASSTSKPYVSSASMETVTKTNTQMGHGDSSNYIYHRTKINITVPAHYMYSKQEAPASYDRVFGFYDRSGGSHQTTSQTVTGNFDINLMYSGIIDDANGVRHTAVGTLKLYFVTNKKTVTFDANGGSGGKSVTDCYCKTVTAPTVTKSGYSCTGWYTAASGGTYVTGEGGSVSMSTTRTLYAQWEAEKYTIKYDSNGGSGSISDQKVSVGSSFYLSSASRLSKTGYNFSGWSTSSTAISAMYSDGAYITSDLASGNGSITLYAVWTAKSYTLQVNPSSGTLPYRSIYGSKQGTTQTASLTVIYGSKNNNQIGAPTRFGYNFVGYYDSSSGGNKVFDSDGDAVSGSYWSGWYSNGVWNYDGNLTVYARWEKIPYTITFYNSGSKYTSLSVYEGESINWKVSYPTKTGYVFNGWYTSDGVMVYDNSGCSNDGTIYWDSAGNWKYKGDVSVYAQWIPISSVITFHVNGGTAVGFSDNNNPKVTVEYDSSQNKSVGTAVKTDYIFLGWYDSSGEQVYDNSGNYVSGNYWSTSGTYWKYTDVTLTAQWKSAYTSVSFRANGGSGTMSSQTVRIQENTVLNANRFTRKGYEFIGWSKEKYPTGSILVDRGTINIYSSTTYYAQWRKIGTGFIQSPMKDGNMFYDTSSIQGEKGTKFRSDKINSEYAHIDVTDAPGYFSEKKYTFKSYE